MSEEKKLNGTVIVTYRCNARCSMCNRYKAPSKPEEEISIETIKKLPKMYFTNITGGEPFIRTDLKDIVRELYKKSDRIVISTNGFFTDRIVDLCKEFPQIGIRISIEGLEQTNNEIRGLQNGYQRGYSTLKKLREMGMKDVGFGMTVQDKNAPDLVPLYKISDEMGMEFATASLHNSFYFVEAKNIIHDRPMVAKNFENLVNELLRSNSPKKWFRAYFNHGLINYIYGQKRLLPCDMRTAATSFATIVPPWLAVDTRNTPGQRTSQLCTSPHGELFGAWNIPPVRFRSACMRAAFSKMAFSSGEK